MGNKRGSTDQLNTDNLPEKTVQCYLCGRSIIPRYTVERIEPRLATRFHGKKVTICIYCAEEWDEEYPDSVPANAPALPELPEESVQAETKTMPEHSPGSFSGKPEKEPPLTRRQAERLAWYENAKPVKGYDVKAAILRDDALGAIAQQAERLGVSYGYLMVMKQREEQPT